MAALRDGGPGGRSQYCTACTGKESAVQLQLSAKLACCTMENAPVMSAWLAMMAAAVASTTTGQITACGTDSQ